MDQVVVSIWMYSTCTAIPHRTSFCMCSILRVARSILTVLTVTNTRQHGWLRCAGIDPAMLVSNVGLEMIK